MSDDIETLRGRYANLVWETGHTPDYVRDIMDLIARLRAAEEALRDWEERTDGFTREATEKEEAK